MQGSDSEVGDSEVSDSDSASVVDIIGGFAPDEIDQLELEYATAWMDEPTYLNPSCVHVDDY